MRSISAAAMALLVVSTQTAFGATNGQNVRKSTRVSSEVRDWSAFLNLSNSAAKSFNGEVVTGPARELGNAAVNNGLAFELEAGKRITPYFGLHGLVGITQVEYKTSGLGKQTLFSVMLMPRAEYEIDNVTPWVGFGFGAANINQPGLLSVSGVSIMDNMLGYTLSPRLGVDVTFANNFLVGAQLIYRHVEGGLERTVIASAGSSPEATRISERIGSVEYGLRAGVRF